MLEFTQSIQSHQETSINIDKLEAIVDEFPYFQLPKAILLKKYHTQEDYKYNHFLKLVSAQTVSREVLFDYITHFKKIPKKKLPEEITKKSLEKVPNLEFTKTDKHSFNQWLQLSDTTPIIRNEKKNTGNSKLNIINKFIQNNPKISPIKKPIQPNKNTLKVTDSEISNELMTETLAKVYLAQKKYDNAIQAYKILSLKYPEKSGLFADQIQQIKTLQNT